MTAMTNVDKGLIFDIGLHNGDDSDYYLSLGYRVVGVDANPVLVDRAKVRFAEQIKQGRLKVVNSGVLREPGVFTFYKNLTDDGWSSFVAARGKKGEWEEIEVPCVTTKQLFVEHGRPYFMKVDIEGADLQTLSSLTSLECPPYVSLELSAGDPILERLIELGYTAFKFVDGECYWPAPPIFEHEIGWRVLRKAGNLAPPIKKAIASLPQPLRPKAEWNPAGKHSPENHPFTEYSSGPFGESAAGQWMTPAKALDWFGTLCENYRRAGGEESLWWDVHARHGLWDAGT